MKRYKRLFESSEGNTYKSLLIDYMIFLHNSWIDKYPDDKKIKDCQYMNGEIDRWAPEWQSFIVKSFDKNLFIKPSSFKAPTKPCSTISSRCYYNSLDYMHRYFEENKGLKLCIGFIVEQKVFDELKTYDKYNRSPMPFITKHVFILEGNKVIDPTLGSSFKNDYYCYRIVPENVWKKLHYKKDDSQQDARELEKYFDSILSSEKTYFNFEKEFLKKCSQ